MKLTDRIAAQEEPGAPGSSCAAMRSVSFIGTSCDASVRPPRRRPE